MVLGLEARLLDGSAEELMFAAELVSVQYRLRFNKTHTCLRYRKVPRVRGLMIRRA